MQYKITMIFLAGLNLLLIHCLPKLTANKSESDTNSVVIGALSGAASLMLWIGVITAGRWIGHSL